MSDPHDLPQDQSAIDEQIAGEVAENILRSHPHASPEFRRKLVSLYVLQALGAEEPPVRITNRALAAHLEMDERRVGEALTSAVSKVAAYLTRHPEIVSELL